jgi:uncharacterized membrane protein YphA (DoxX/SURF4 family)
MGSLRALFDRIDEALAGWMARYGILLLRLSLGVIFLWFGALKFFPGYSPAADLAARTITTLTFGMLSESVALFILATWETLIGFGLLFGWQLRIVLLLLWVQMLGTVTPIFLFPSEVFTSVPLVPTLEGQYIFKNIVLVSAGLVIGATVRGGRVASEPEQIKGKAKKNLV